MALDFSNIHSLKRFEKKKNNRKKPEFNFERKYNFSINLKKNHSIFPFFEKEVALEDVVFFDTETTGLSHGAGNMVFLAGLGFLDGNRFVVRQYFVSNPSVEHRLIETVVDLFSKKRVVISYNGKCFDIPVIKTRCAMNGICEPDIEQIDLYHISRFIWKDRFKSFRLIDVEREVLGFKRKDDLPGSMAPFAYREFLLRGERKLLEKVFKHNLRDVYSLLKLYFRVGDESCWDILLAKARKHFKEKNFESALEYLRKVVKLEVQKTIKKDAYFLASMCLKRIGEVEKAVALWERIGDVSSLIELAKFYEHKKKDFMMALECTEKAIRKIDSKHAVLFADLLKRKKRLKQKLGF